VFRCGWWRRQVIPAGYVSKSESPFPAERLSFNRLRQLAHFGISEAQADHASTRASFANLLIELRDSARYERRQSDWWSIGALTHLTAEAFRASTRAPPPSAVQHAVLKMANTLSGSPGAVAPANGNGSHTPTTGFWALTIGSVGVVYGDIGTSPLYAFREATLAAMRGDGAVTQASVLGVLSMILWSLILVVTVKYVLILTRANNNGEGGTLALMALAQKALGRSSLFVLLLGVVAAALFYGDAVITPALSVLSAVEGLEVAAPHLDDFVLPLTIAILVALFLVQSRGTAKVAAFFGPITSVWFIAIGVIGLIQIAGNPVVLLALNPYYAASFLTHHNIVGFVTLGAVFLAVTGAEALYADLGHFGRKPIQTAWLGFVLPALAINYVGQGALVLAAPETLENPFFLMYPEWARLPMVGLATAATVIASQAVITGAYSLSRQAVQLSLVPRLEIRHTSEAHAGQIYMPRVNVLLLLGVLLLVGLFRSSSALAGAYGIAVTGTMVVTALLAFVVIWKLWKWNLVAAAALVAPFLLLDLMFLAANLLKVVDGGWFPLLLGGMLMVVMLTWRRGSRILFEKTRRLDVPLADIVHNLEKNPPPRVPGTAIFLTGDPASTPTALLHSLKHYKVLHEENVILTVLTENTPRVDPSDRVAFQKISPTFARMTVRYGFMETPNLPKALAVARKLGFTFDIMSTSFFLSRRSVRSGRGGMPVWQDKLFILLTRNADDASRYFQIPTDRVVEIGMQVTV
jgi:KUP system potassium uptake protein